MCVSMFKKDAVSIQIKIRFSEAKTMLCQRELNDTSLSEAFFKCSSSYSDIFWIIDIKLRMSDKKKNRNPIETAAWGSDGYIWKIWSIRNHTQTHTQVLKISPKDGAVSNSLFFHIIQAPAVTINRNPSDTRFLHYFSMLYLNLCWVTFSGQPSVLLRIPSFFPPRPNWFRVYWVAVEWVELSHS